MKNDLTFFTNEPNQTLLERFKTTLKYVQYFDILVGYFRTSGFDLLSQSLEPIDKIRILVGLNVDSKSYTLILNQKQQLIDFLSHEQTQQLCSEELIQEMEQAADTYDTERGVHKFIQFLNSGKLEIKAHPSQNIHAKVYISRFHSDKHTDYGKVITGSSNFSAAGFFHQYEFNVELKNAADVEYALEKFEDLWCEGVDISQTYVDTIRHKTWLNNQISPYHLYLKFLYEYFKEDINLDTEFEVQLPNNFLELQYQKQAVIAAKQILESYNGVFLADVVGLGKTFIAALLAQQLSGKKLIICPPVLKEYWEDTFREFFISNFQVESLGKLEHILRSGKQFDYIFIDEAHRFRNENTQTYESLYRLCWTKKVILISATPYNNKIDDIESLLKLFQSPRKSLIPGVPNLEKFFSELKKRLKKYDKDTVEHFKEVKQVAQLVRDKILKYVMVRRTRTEVKRFFKTDIEQQGLFFPHLEEPKRLIYQFDTKTDAIFNETIRLLKNFNYARYTPLLYLTETLSEFDAQSQRNVRGFMKGLLIKRLESSAYAFQKSIERFTNSYLQFIKMYQEGKIYISKKVNVYELLDADNEEELIRLVEQDKAESYLATAFKLEFLDALEADLATLRAINALWDSLWTGISKNAEADVKFKLLIQELKQNPILQAAPLIIFTESTETGFYLSQSLEAMFSHQVMFYHSGGGHYQGKPFNPQAARELIKQNYDPNHHSLQADIRILITTDVLAEGINLHRSNVIINYDLPWNPTRVLQRVGRVNRVGTKHQSVYIFNFFPTVQADEHLGLEDNIKSKIQAFHELLGEDAKYLTDAETFESHNLFGETLYNKLQNTTDECEERSELEFLQLIRQIRDDEPELFEKIKRLPKKARSARQHTILDTEQVVSFFRLGRLKKFFLSSESELTQEINFLQAVDNLACEKDSPRAVILKSYYDLLAQNKAAFEESLNPETVITKSRRSNDDYIMKRLKEKSVRLCRQFTDDDEEYIQLILKALEAGNLPKRSIQKTKKALEMVLEPLEVLQTLKKHIPFMLLSQPKDLQAEVNNPREIILSCYLSAN
jgi:superfamily II DNA or RNA helicase/HKD family nuclease